MIEERRKHPRFPFHCKGELRIDYVPCLGELVDLSRHGALFRTGIVRIGLEHEKQCALDILHLNNNLLCSVSGHIAHWQDNLVGVRFDALDNATLEKIMHVGKLNLAPERVFNRSLAALLQAA